MKWLKVDFLFPLFALVILVFALSQQIYKAPPVGKILDPFTGVVQNEKDLLNINLDIDRLGLHHPVHIYFDERKVPHIYAADNSDLYFAQGYVTASLRLWQMDFLSYMAAGRLAEIFGKDFIDHDRRQRRMGIPAAASASLALMEKDAATNEVLEAFTKGVNAYIAQLNYKTMPFEYKFLDYEPEPWTKLKSVLLMKQMANTLSGFEEDLNMTQLMLTLGEAKFNKLFPGLTQFTTPVVNYEKADINPSLVYLKKPGYLDYSFLSSGSVMPSNAYNPSLGSNSWVVSGKKTKSGFPLLCNDPHLNLALPAVWLEMQMTAPGINVYGVSIPGIPAVVIGFNREIAWGLTNGADDVKDWYKLKITSDYQKYELDGRWIPLLATIEEIKIRSRKPIYDTIYRSIHGPLVSTVNYPGPQPGLINHALKWRLHEASNEIGSLLLLNRAHNYNDFKQALQSWSCPSQNFTFACRDNTIAVHHQGGIAKKWPGQGRFILDGTTSSHLYTGNIPADSLPMLVDPSCGYLLSANQHPTNERYPYYYSGFFSESRANRIGQLLNKAGAFDIPAMEAMQLDNVNPLAAAALPLLIKNMEGRKINGAGNQYLTRLRQWNYGFNRDDNAAELYNLWWHFTREYTWDEFKTYSFNSRSPDDYVLLNLIGNEPSDSCFDKQGTTAVENAGNIIAAAFHAAVTEYEKNWQKNRKSWGDFNKVNIMHMLNLQQFSKMYMPSGGHPEAINAISQNWGPSWRMIVELGDRPVARGIYPGGQSGNPASKSYDNFIADWNKGNYYTLHYFLSENECRAKSTTTWTLN